MYILYITYIYMCIETHFRSYKLLAMCLYTCLPLCIHARSDIRLCAHEGID